MPSRTFRSTLRIAVNEQDKQARAEMQAEMLDIGNDWRGYYVQVVADWKNKPRFDIRVTNRNNHLRLVVAPQEGKPGQIWRWVDEGTAGPYPIRPKKPGGKLKFRGEYHARTQPVAQYGVGDGKAHGRWNTKDGVMHPGIEAREFGEAAELKFKPEFARRINNAIRRGIYRVSR